MAGTTAGGGPDGPEHQLGAVVVDGLARAYGWSEYDVLHRIPVARALAYLGMTRRHDRDEQRFRAKLAGFDVPEEDGRVHGIRQRQIQKMKQRRGGH